MAFHLVIAKNIGQTRLASLGCVSPVFFAHAYPAIRVVERVFRDRIRFAGAFRRRCSPAAGPDLMGALADLVAVVSFP
jgi:hypothetical protein